MAEQATPEKADAGEFKTFQRKDGSTAKIKKGPKKATAQTSTAAAGTPAPAAASSGGTWLVALGILTGVGLGLAIINKFTSGSIPAHQPAA